jgi:1-acyl-sn-glycerol-3-phosphate acyltransferase
MILLLKNIARTIWRIWFYVLIAALIVVFAPVLILFTLSERTFIPFYWIARNLWARPILYGMGCIPKINYDQRMESNQSYMLVANHTSMLDIMLMLCVSRNPFVFVGKKELARLPLFGYFYKRVCILVDRESSRSRTAVYRRAQKRLQNGLSICIFPEGGVPEDTGIILDAFKDGAFKMAIAHQIPIVPITFFDCKRRFPFEFFEGVPGPLRVRVHSFIQTTGLKAEDVSHTRQQVHELLLNSLKSGK